MTRLASLLLGSLLALSACAKREGLPPVPWSAGHLYLQGSGPIYVEIDASQHCEPDAVSLETLRAFLARHTGREIVLSEPEVLQDEWLPYTDQALKHADGPPAKYRDADYLYVLFYDSDVAADLGWRGTLLAHVPGICPSAIYVNRAGLESGSWIPWDDWRTNLPDVLAHEAGHALGLVIDPEGYERHGSGGHCVDPDCLMLAASNFSWWASFFRATATPNPLCADCLADLERRRTEAHTQRFRAGFLIRSEPDYWVAAAPSVTILGLDPLDDVDLDALRPWLRRAHDRDWGRWRHPGTARTRAAVYAQLDDPARRADHVRGLRAAQLDPNPVIAAVAEQQLGEFEAEEQGVPLRWR